MKTLIDSTLLTIYLFLVIYLATRIQESFKFSTEALILTLIILYLHNIRQRD
jgi:hypothetical protein